MNTESIKHAEWLGGSEPGFHCSLYLIRSTTVINPHFHLLPCQFLMNISIVFNPVCVHTNQDSLRVGGGWDGGMC